MENVFVGNLNFSTTEEELKELFAKYGPVTDVRIMYDRDTKRSRGFGFVEMESGARKAIDQLHGIEFGGRILNVDTAQPKTVAPNGRGKKNPESRSHR